ncbi:MAG: tetratricopeptide repeat protein [Bacteroidales bacterium]|nr:tetratricopeptide repeat protein [Bacteroidales bacterium]MBO7487025.1 tetratricopeptide repeat protein [Bacteroidales bacterium]
MANKNQKPTENQQTVGQAVSGTEEFLKKNGKLLGWIVTCLLLAVVVCLALYNWVIKPAKAAAIDDSFAAENYFAQGEYQTALEGDGSSLGFRDLISQYGAKAGQAVYMYAGVSELQLKNYDEAIKYLKKYKGKDDILAARALSCLGDAYVGTGDLNAALASYEKAIKKAENMYAAAYMLKAGLVCEELGNNDKALEYYQDIKDKYPQSLEAYDIDKYIARIKQ